jgi:hypothetical protein
VDCHRIDDQQCNRPLPGYQSRLPDGLSTSGPVGAVREG